MNYTVYNPVLNLCPLVIKYIIPVNNTPGIIPTENNIDCF